MTARVRKKRFLKLRKSFFSMVQPSFLNSYKSRDKMSYFLYNIHDPLILLLLLEELEWDEALLLLAFDVQIEYSSPGLHFTIAVQVNPS